MKKYLSLLLIVLVLSGCGVTQKSGEDGSNGADGISGEDGRDYITPVIRPYTWDSTGLVLTFNDCGTITEPKLSHIGFGNQSTNDNFISIKVPAGYIGHKLTAVINGHMAEITIPYNTQESYSFQTGMGTDYAGGRFMNIDPLDKTDKNSYFCWYLDNTQKELYFSNTFE